MQMISSETIITETAMLPPFNPCPRFLLPDTRRQRLTTALRRSLVYYTVVEYIGHRGKRMPIGVVVVAPGRDYAQALFNQAKLTMVCLPRSHRWKVVNAQIGRLAEKTPRTLERLEEEIIRQQYIWHAGWRECALAFRPIHCLRCKQPHVLLEQLFEEKVMTNATTQLVEDIEQAEDQFKEEVAAEKAKRAPKATVSIVQFVREMIRQMNADQAETAMTILADQVDEDAYGVATELFKHVARITTSRPIRKEQMERIIALWESIPSQW